MLQGYLVKLHLSVCSGLFHSFRYQTRVALYIAAFYGYIELTEWALKQGVRPHETVGVHPYRAWCQEALHTDVSKCPIHAAAEAGQLLILKAFVNCSVLCLDCKNAAGQTPLAIACKHKHKDCVLYLLSKMWSTVSFLKISVSMRIYIKIKQWVLRAQSHNLNKGQLCGARVLGAKVGDVVMVDGFTKPKMTSKSWQKAMDKDSQGGIESKPPPLREQTVSRKLACPLAVAQQDTREEIVRFPPLVDANTFSELQKRQQPQLGKKKSSLKIHICPKSLSLQFQEWAIHTHLFTMQLPVLTFYSDLPLHLSQSIVGGLQGRTPSTA